MGDETALKNSALLLQQSRSGEGRQQLLNTGVANILPSILEPPKSGESEYVSGDHSRKTLIWGLQLARNLCAAGETACMSLVQTGLLKTVLALLEASQQAQSCHLQLQKPLLQLLVNMAASSSTCLQHIWDQCFPGRFVALAKTLSEGTAGPLSTLLLLAAKDSPPRASLLCSPSAAALLSPLLTYTATCPQPSAAAGTLGLIIHHVIWQQNLLQAAMTSLTLYSSQRTCQQVLRLQPCLEHVVIIQLLADELEDPVAASRSQARQCPEASLNFSIYWVHGMCVSLSSQQCPLPMFVQSLEAGLQVLRALTAQDEAEKIQDGLPQDQLITLLTLALAMLAALNPIQPPRRHAKTTQQPGSTQAEPSSESILLSKQQNAPNEDALVSGPTAETQMQEAEPSPAGGQPQQAAGLHSTQEHQAAPHLVADLASQHDSSFRAQSQADAHNQTLSEVVNHLLSQQNAESPEQLVRLAQQFPRQSPYKGYRCDLVALLANLCFRRLAVQNKVQQLGGTELILSQCQWDDENPLVREYGLWAVRNLCEGNDAIQESISSLRAHSTVDCPELQQIGMKIELDGKTGKPKMVAQGA
ncbi:TPA: hypothetical protein ACH3X1_001465 [Trebouxia sp. C0004]